ncbi:MAG: sigma 54-interacting transcriptional regulator [Clostridiaceae bacterium]|nr:sigma 54-interacting transcriptional regulator [Clostridiaceae bacterium]
MFENNKFIKQFTDMMSEGFIFIDTFGKIQIYNNKAKEIFGILGHEGIGHDAGKIEDGDIVIISNNCFGRDDGNLQPEDLKCLGMHDENIHAGNSIIVVGVMNNAAIAPVYLYKQLSGLEEKLQLDVTFLNQKLHAVIDNTNKHIKINVNDQSFLLNFLQAIGHMVVLDGNSKKVKFYQTKGYTAKQESIGQLLRGRSYRGKGRNVEDFPVIDKKIFDIHSDNETIKEFYEVAKGKNLSYEEKFTEINGRSTICTLKPVNVNDQRVGAVLKVEDISEIRKVIRERDEALLHLEQMEELLKEAENTSKLFPEIIGESEAMSQVKQLAYKASKSNSTVLILGESGTGKSILANAIHKASKYREKPFIYVNSGSIQEHLLESELFGYEGGAFTGAKKEGKIGMFELAHGGTIFLDEIGEISPAVQVKLLQVLQNKNFYRVGGNKKISVDVRIIAATNKNLEEEMAKNKFREDLYYRINVFPIWAPPLRDRKEDIYPLVHSLLPKICSRIGCHQKRISGEALYKLMEYDWPGNVRELENIVERAVNLAEGNTIVSKHLITGSKKMNSVNISSSIEGMKEVIAKAEKRAIEEALNIYEGNKQEAMKALKIGKTSFYEKLKKYNIK